MLGLLIVQDCKLCTTLGSCTQRVGSPAWRGNPKNLLDGIVILVKIGIPFPVQQASPGSASLARSSPPCPWLCQDKKLEREPEGA